MGSHHDHNSNEKKPVAFTVPLIFASVIVLIIVLLVSLGDPDHGCCCDKGECSKECMDACKAGTCEKGGCCDPKAAHLGGHHGDAHGTEAGHHDVEAHKDTAATASPAIADSTAKTEHKEEAHH